MQLDNIMKANDAINLGLEKYHHLIDNHRV